MDHEQVCWSLTFGLKVEQQEQRLPKRSKSLLDQLCTFV